MSKLEESLKEWLALGFLSADQAKKIQDHENAKPETSWILSGLLILGVIIVGIGLISLIAANWNLIPDLVKLGTDFLLLVSLALATVRAWAAKKHILFETLLLFFLLLCLASIGLISQIFHTGGELYQALLFWTLITAGAAMAARQILVPWLWTGAFLTGITFAALKSELLQTFFQQNSPAIFLCAPLLCVVAAFISKRYFGEIAATRAFRAWILVGGGLALLSVEFFFSLPKQGVFSLTPFIPSYSLAIGTFVAIWRNPDYRTIQKILLFWTLGLYLIPFHLMAMGIVSSVAYAALTILILGFMAIFQASKQGSRLFHLLLFFVGMRFLILYFQALGGLALTGVGLIVSGGIVIGLTVLWHKYRVALSIWAERWAR